MLFTILNIEPPVRQEEIGGGGTSNCVNYSILPGLPQAPGLLIIIYVAR